MSSVFSPLCKYECGAFPWPVQIEHAPARMLGKRALLRRIHVWDRHPVWSLHPFLPCCSSVASQPELNIGPLSPNFPSSPSKAFLSSPLCFLSPLSPSYLPPPPHLPASLSLSPSPSLCQFPMVGTFRDFGWRNGKHSSNSTSCCCQRRFPQWVTWWPGEGVCCWPAVCAPS